MGFTHPCGNTSATVGNSKGRYYATETTSEATDAVPDASTSSVTKSAPSWNHSEDDGNVATSAILNGILKPTYLGEAS